MNLNSQKITPKEKELLEIISKRDYSSIKVKKSNGNLIIYAEKIKSDSNYSLSDLERLIKEKDYQDIHITKRDGKIVNLKIEETIKLKAEQ